MFHQAVQVREKTLGKDHSNTLDSKYWLGQTLYKQEKYQEAEEIFYQAVQGYEKTLSKDHSDTLDSKHWLGRTLYKQEKYQEAEEIFHQAVKGREKTLGKDHSKTLASKHCLGQTLYKLKKYQEAEEMFHQAVQGYKKTHSKDHSDTLDSKYWLGETLYKLKKYQEAEELFHQAVQGYKKTHSKDHSDTLDSKHWLGRTLYKLKKYQEAEELFHQAVQGYEKTYSKDHSNTLDSKHYLGRTLYELKKYQEAEEFFYQAVQGSEKTLSKNHSNTLDSKHWLGRTLYQLKKYQEAEEFFYQGVQGSEKTLGKNHSDTLDCKHWLGQTLYKQEKYQEAEEIFHQAVKEREKTLGKDHSKTLTSRHWLGQTLYELKKYQEAEELFCQAVQGREKTLGKDHSDTLASKHLLQEVLRTAGSPTITNDTTTTLANRLGDFFPRAKESRPPYHDSEIYQISALLKQVNFSWSRVPRTYIVLRTIDCLHLLGELIDIGFSDYWFPVDESTVPDCLTPKMRACFIDAQQLVLTKSMDLEKSEGGRHRYFKKDEPLPFESKGTLGAGGFGQVDKVLSLISFREYARKRVPRKAALGGRGPEAMKGIVAEIEIMKKLKHRHIVEFVGSYTDRNYLGLIMSPVAEMDLSLYLKKAESSQHAEIRTFLGCLATALQFLHDQQIRHKDIKPGNILVDRGNILLTDFGLALDFTDASGSTTVGMVNGMTARYCAPEVVLHEARNTSSDIWSLGIVFLEMTVVLKDRTVEWMNRYFETHGSQQIFARSNPAGLGELMAELKRTGSPSDNEILSWIQQMLQEDRTLRLTAARLVTLITSLNSGRRRNTVYCGICCLAPDHGFSDSSDELEDNEA